MNQLSSCASLTSIVTQNEKGSEVVERARKVERERSYLCQKTVRTADGRFSISQPFTYGFCVFVITKQKAMGSSDLNCEVQLNLSVCNLVPSKKKTNHFVLTN